MRNRGHFVLEGALATLLMTASLLLNIELIRRAWYASLGHEIAFRAVRWRALGVSQSEVRKRADRLWHASLGRPAFRLMEQKSRATGLEVRFWHRFPMLMKFRLSGQNRHHFEQTRRCLFPF